MIFNASSFITSSRTCTYMIVPYPKDHVKVKEGEEKQTRQVVFRKSQRKPGRNQVLWISGPVPWSLDTLPLRPCLAPGHSKPQHMCMWIIRGRTARISST